MLWISALWNLARFKHYYALLGYLDPLHQGWGLRSASAMPSNPWAGSPAQKLQIGLTAGCCTHEAVWKTIPSSVSVFGQSRKSPSDTQQTGRRQKGQRSPSLLRLQLSWLLATSTERALLGSFQEKSLIIGLLLRHPQK